MGKIGVATFFTFCIIGVFSNTDAVKKDVPFDPLINMFKKQELLLKTMERTMQLMKSKVDATEKYIKVLDGKLNAVDSKLDAHVKDAKNQASMIETNVPNVITELKTKKCRVGLSGNKFGCYKFGTTEIPWAAASEACEVEGGRLAIIETTEKFEALTQLMTTEKVPQAHYWVDGVKKGLGNTFVWNGTNVTVGPISGAIDSSMLSRQHILDLEKFLPEKAYKLLYKATRDGMSLKAFHSRCDNKGATLSIGLDATTGSVFGGYTPRSWTGRGGVVYGSNTFLIRLCENNCSSKKHELKNQQKQSIYDDTNYGPLFGGGDGHDLVFFYNKAFTFDSTRGYFDTDGYCKGKSFYGGGLGCGTNVKWRDVEVYSVADTTDGNCLSLHHSDQQWVPWTCTNNLKYICEV